MIRAIVVDDEDLAREGLILLLQDFNDVSVVAACSNGIEAVEQTRRLKPDILFLDIQMPQVNGFDVLELLEDELPAVVFVTAHDQFAVKAFETEALDYLLKPVGRERLAKTIEKVRQQGKISPQIVKRLLELRQPENRFLQQVTVKETTQIEVVQVKDVLFFEAQDDYVAIHTRDKVFLKNERLGKLEELLDPASFVRIHRSYIVNLTFLQKIENQRWAVLKNNKNLPVSRSGYSKLVNR